MDVLKVKKMSNGAHLQDLCNCFGVKSPEGIQAVMIERVVENKKQNNRLSALNSCIISAFRAIWKNSQPGDLHRTNALNIVRMYYDVIKTCDMNLAASISNLQGFVN